MSQLTIEESNLIKRQIKMYNDAKNSLTEQKEKIEAELNNITAVINVLNKAME